MLESMNVTSVAGVARRRALALARAAIGRAQSGEAHALEVDVAPRPLLARLLEEDALARAIVLLERDGQHGRIVVLPRRARGAPTIAELLEADHCRLDDIAARMAQSAPTNPMRAVVLAHLFSVGIRRHIGAEEQVLFPIYRSHLSAAADRIAPLEREHRAILMYVERTLRAAEHVLGPYGRNEGVEELLQAHRGVAGVLADHNDREERILFPLLDRMLDKEARREVLRRLVLF
jgi:hemerythrin-like domain-containing protein